jgi:hypothetical protein
MFRSMSLFASAAFLAFVGCVLLASPVSADGIPYPYPGNPPPNYMCDTNAQISCSCVATGANTVCYDFNQPVILIWCTANGQTPCVAAGNINCPGNGVVANGTCAGGFVETNTPCPNIATTSCAAIAQPVPAPVQVPQ